jgi:hypothetical protein
MISCKNLTFSRPNKQKKGRKSAESDVIKFEKGFLLRNLVRKNNSKSKGIESILFTHFLSFLIGRSLPLTCFLSIDTKDSGRGTTSKVRY